MKPFKHARISAKKFGGIPEDYIGIHEFMDISKSSVADVRHRAILHHALGCYIAAKAFGEQFYNSAGKIVDVRDVAEQHIIDDLGYIPPVEHWLRNIPISTWMGGNKAKIAYKEMRGKNILNINRTPIKSNSDALDFIKAHKGIVQFEDNQIRLTVVSDNDMMNLVGTSLIDVANKARKVVNKNGCN